MCGIIAVAGNTAGLNKASILQSISHRGPDASGWEKIGDTILGHTRLSIIDLDANANQPMKDSTSRYSMVFNGEIYNYRELAGQIAAPLKTKSDTEVLLELFVQKGLAALDELIGMFAFVIYDSLEKVVWAVRDRFGVKPCYYSHTNNTFIISSEIKTLWAAGITKEAHEATWSTYLCYGHYGSPNETFWKNIQSLPAGHWMKYDLPSRRLEIKKWYDLSNNNESRILINSKKNWLEAYNNLLKDAVSLRFRSDVPVGVTLSGGLDSSLLFSTINEVYGKNNAMQSFTFYANNKNYDENEWVKTLLRNSHMQANFVLLKADEVPNLAGQIARYQDEPYGGLPTIAYAKCFAAARAMNIPVILDGQGVDEAWAGYDYYRSQHPGFVQGTSQQISYANAISPEFSTLATAPKFQPEGSTALQKLQYRDITETKLPRALRFNDRISMMHSIELREPLLDHRLVEMAFHAPDHFKVQENQGKYLLRKLAEEKAGREIATAPKRPVQTPQREWLANELSWWVDETIDKISYLPVRHWFNKKEMQSLWSKYQAGQMDNSFFIWQWINTVLLFEED